MRVTLRSPPPIVIRWHAGHGAVAAADARLRRIPRLLADEFWSAACRGAIRLRRGAAIGTGDRTDHPPNRTPTPRGYRRPRLRPSVGRTQPARARRAQRGDSTRE